LGFVHPVTGEMMFFDSELPADFISMVEAWRRYSSASVAYLEE
jgi:23S rRNA pseudouridine1911/1915/1917 synthase